MMDNKYTQNTPEWLEMRRDYVMASDVPALMGVCRYKTPYMIWQDKLGLAKPQLVNANMQYGKDKEAESLAYFNTLGLGIAEPAVVFHPTIKHMGASLDGLTDEMIIVEIKQCNDQDFATALLDKLPDMHYAQVQAQMACVGIDFMNYLACNGGKYKLVTVKRNDEYIENMIKVINDFWNNNVLAMVPPALTDKDFRLRDPDWVTTAAELDKVKKQIKELQAQDAKLSADLQHMSEDENSMGGEYRYTKIVQPGKVSYSKIPEIKQIDLKPYTGESYVQWRLTKDKNGS